MRLLVLPVLIVIVVGALIDLYIYRRIPRTDRRWRRVCLAQSVFFAILMAATLCLPTHSGSDSILRTLMWLLYAYFSVYVSKLLFIVFDFLGALPKIVKKKRIRLFTYIGGVAGLLVFGLMWWGALINRFRTDVRPVTIEVPDLPEAFDGYRIVQLSDLHTGTYGDDTTYLHKLVGEVNALHPDLIVFTGDIVNRRTRELLPHVATLGRLRAADGIYSILGNHDYGDYAHWPNETSYVNNNRQLRMLQSEMGWKLLRNQTAWLTRANDSIALIGVENIGEPPFTVYGDLDRSYNGDLADRRLKILLSHNPMHWVDDISGHADKNIFLTLSGHTHAMQIELFGFSPAALRYPVWGGYYTDSLGHKLYVNIGIGTVGTPMRIGATPEITLLTLRKAE